MKNPIRKNQVIPGGMINLILATAINCLFYEKPNTVKNQAIPCDMINLILATAINHLWYEHSNTVNSD